MKKINIAIDGPASSGKSTVAKILASKFGFVYIDTGAMYRCVTLLAIDNQVDFSDDTRLVELIEKNKIHFEMTQTGQRVYLNEQEVTQSIRENEVTRNVSFVAMHAAVREKLVCLQRMMSEQGGVVMDGRDIGTVVLPRAQVKIFLVASVAERAQRRFDENIQKGIACELVSLREEIKKRDHLDSTRKTSPLTQAKDAILVDTTGLSIEEVVEKIEKIVLKKIKIRENTLILNENSLQ